jgi:hypothetical protein
MSTITLRTGKEVSHEHLAILMVTLDKLARQDANAYYELVALCRNPEHKLYIGTDKTLRELKLIEKNNQPVEVTRDIVLASAEGEGLNLKLVSPVKQSQDDSVQHSILAGDGPFIRK